MLFNLYMYDLVTFLRSFDCGIDIDGENVCILLYADDVVILATDKNELQMLFCHPVDSPSVQFPFE